jgi:hypothetical protein
MRMAASGSSPSSGHPLAVWSTRFLAHRVMINFPNLGSTVAGRYAVHDGALVPRRGDRRLRTRMRHDVQAADGVEPKQEVSK